MFTRCSEVKNDTTEFERCCVSVTRAARSVLVSFFFFHKSNCVVAPVYSSGLDGRLKVTAAVPVVVLRGHSYVLWFGADSIHFFIKLAGMKKFGRPWKSLQSCSSSIIRMQ